MIEIMASSLHEAANLGILIMVYIFVHALFAKAMFYHPLTQEDGTPFRTNFINTRQSILSVLLCMTGNWILPMNTVAKEYGSWVALFFVEMVLVGEFMLLNLFMSILLKNSSNHSPYHGYTSGIYDYSLKVVDRIDKVDRVIIEVKALQDVFIALAEEPEHDSIKYEIHLGGQKNIISQVRLENLGGGKANFIGKVLDPFKYKTFIIDWDYDYLTVS